MYIYIYDFGHFSHKTEHWHFLKKLCSVNFVFGNLCCMYFHVMLCGGLCINCYFHQLSSSKLTFREIKAYSISLTSA